MRVLLLDNYDSFTWNLYHLLVVHVPVEVVRNDAITPGEAGSFDRIVLSPGPGLPGEAGVMMDLLRAWAGRRPILGVCLGMQGIVEHCGGHLFQQQRVMHGVEVDCVPSEPRDSLFAGMPSPFTVGLYHSWAADPVALPEELRITARSGAGVIMAVRHTEHDLVGVQFHPESVMTPLGGRIIANWLGA
ncbi:MAG: aminodeoxychorismate/anthranilate synthase component II [Flavobacteriales bacterium]|nr:aminodeoxychorismate/anthranilate synthase component II [Flavobacteriales bacterium]MCB9166266.1 aminodeoxychorismate/anthranilate synthase component II [Flavobacteriales bacterium]